MISILYQNTDFVAIDKPCGLSVHNLEDTENILSVMSQQLNIDQLWPVHRLDKETSGVQLLSFNAASAQKLSQIFQERSVRKIYHGVLRGCLKQDQGVWSNPITDRAEGRKAPAGQTKDRVASQTEYKVLETSKYFTMCEFNLKTGRQHQIRKHSAIARHALVGDNRYGEPQYNQKIFTIYKTERMFLHCHRLEFLDFKIVSPIPSEFFVLFKETQNQP